MEVDLFSRGTKMNELVKEIPPVLIEVKGIELAILRLASFSLRRTSSCSDRLSTVARLDGKLVAVTTSEPSRCATMVREATQHVEAARLGRWR